MAGFLGPLLLILLLLLLGIRLRILVSIRVCRSELPVAGIRLLGLRLVRLVRLLLVLIVVSAFCGFTLLVLVLSGSRSRSCPHSHLR